MPERFSGSGREAFPLSSSQRNIWDLEKAFPGTSMNLISTTIRISGHFDVSVLQRAIDAVLAADASLRTRLELTPEGPMQYHGEMEYAPQPALDFSLTDAEGFSQWETSTAREPLPLLDAPLYRFYIFRSGEDEGGLFVKTHHIISDGWSQVLLCNRLAAAYLELLDGGEPSISQSPGYELHVAEENEYLASGACAADEEYWRQTLAQAGAPSVLKDARGAALSPVGRRLTFRLPDVLNHAVYTFCSENRVAPFSVFYMALAIYLRRMGGAARFTIGVPVHNRMNFTARETTGMFVSTLPLCNELDESWDLLEFNDQLALRWFELLRHQRMPFSRIAALRESGEGRLFHIALSYQDTKILESDAATVCFSGRWHYSGYQSEQLCIHLTNLEDNRRYTVDYDYLSQLFSDSEIERLHRYLCRILEQALAQPNRPIGQLSILSLSQREQVLYGFNAAARRPAIKCGAFQALLETASARPNRTAVIENGVRVSYGGLMEMASGVSALLIDRLEGEENLVAVMLPGGSAQLAAMAGILGSGNGWLFLSPALPERRAADIIRKCGAAMLIAAGRDMERLSPLLPGNVALLDADAMPAPVSPARWRPGGPEALAYVVSTSGSTGEPKSVELTCANLLNFCRGERTVFPAGAILSISSVGFDAYIAESAAALINGLTIVMTSPAQREDPRALAALIKDYGVKYISLTPSRLSAYLSDGDFRAAAAGLDAIVCGGEPFPGELLSRLKRLTGAAVWNQYGPSETTVCASSARLDTCLRITAGAPMPGCRLYVLDQRLQPMPVGVYGELYIGGAGVGRGYRHAPELTAQAFLPSPFVAGEKVYRTGDIAAWTADGQIVIAGRRDEQVKLRGQRVEPQELASCLALHPMVTDAAAKVADIGGQSVLAAYYTSAAPLEETELLTYLAARLPAYMLPAAIARLDAIPLTANGKADTGALPVPRVSSGSLSPQSPLQERILDIFKSVLGRPSLGADSDYFLSGGNSLSAMETIGRLEDVLGVRLRVSDLYACRTAEKLEAYYLAAAGEKRRPGRTPLRPAPRAESYPLSPIQQGIFVECSAAPGGTAYNMPGVLRLGAALDAGRLENAFKSLIASDDLLSTAFVFKDGDVRQVIKDRVDFALEDISGSSLDEAFGAFVRPFDLSAPPLIRAGLFSLENENYLFVDFHHMIGDGLSTPLMLRRLDAFYSGKNAAPALTYKDYCAALEKEGGQELDPYWLEALADFPPPLELPADMPRPRPFDHRGGEVSFVLGGGLSKRCADFCGSMRLTPFMLFAAAFGLLLSRISSRRDLIVGTPVSDRERPELMDICGPFINTLPLRLRPDGATSAEDYLNAVRQAVLGMLDGRAFSAGQAVTSLGLPRELGENPLFDAMFSLRPLDADAVDFAGGSAFVPMASGTAKLPLNLEAAQTEGGFAFRLEYASSLFLPETAALYGRCFTRLVGELISRPGAALEELAALDAGDELRLLTRQRRMTAPFWDAPVDEMFSEIAAVCPDAPAVIFHDKTVTYAALEAMASGVARLLSDNGARPGEPVGLICRRTPMLFAALLGILKAGCAYVPMLASYPKQRLDYMLKTAGVSRVLTDGETLAALPDGLEAEFLEISEKLPPLEAPVPHGTELLMYILFTSGSTGRPKGVMVSGRAAANFACAMRPLLERDGGPIMCSTNMVFDIFLVESLLPLTLGRTVVLADEEEMVLPWKMAERMLSAGVTTAQLTPSALQMCLTSDAFRAAAAGLKLLFLAGEASSSHIVSQIRQVCSAELIDVYGPTEATVYVSWSELEAGRPVTIGRPLQNCRLYVLDENRRPALPTAVGELYLAGVCLAEGYVGRDDLTAAAFVPDPFFPGERMYKTGDLGRLRADGSFECLGRMDSQIKLNGLRVELEEINGAGLESCLVSQMVTLQAEDAAGGGTLRAFAVPSEGLPAPEELKRRMAELLPEYMLPSQFVFLKKMPKNPSGKIDMPLLRAYTPEKPGPLELFVPENAPAERKPAPAGAAPEAEPCAAPLNTPAAVAAAPQKAPEGYDEVFKALEGVWREVLGRQPEAEVSFFHQGGSSLAALNILSRCFNLGYSLTLAQFYASPTLAAQAALLSGGAPDSPTFAPEAENQEKLLLRPAPAGPLAVDDSPFESVLLTGATGFLGAHLLRALLENGALCVLCLVRGGDRKRLLDNLTYYFGSEWTLANAFRIEVVRGDVSKPRFGLARDAWQRLAAQVDAVFNAAADVRHYTSDPEGSLAVNLGGACASAELALAAGASLSHVSTISVSGDYIPQKPGAAPVFTESDYDIGQNWQDNIYVKGKYLAEGAIFDMAGRGLRARVFRVGRLVGRASDGRFQPDAGSNALCAVLRGAASLGALPETMAAMPVDLTPVDFCAGAIVRLSGEAMPVCHVYHPAPFTFLDAAGALNESIKVLPDVEFAELLAGRLKDGAPGLDALVDILNRRSGSPALITPDNSATMRTLERLGFDLAPADPRILLREFKS